MREDIEKLFTARQRKYWVSTVMLFFMACYMTLEYYSHDRAMASLSGGDPSMSWTHVVSTVMTGMLWCVCCQSAESLLQMRFLRQLATKMMAEKQDENAAASSG